MSNAYKRGFLLISYVAIAIMTKVMQFSILPPKYFYDSNNILNLIENPYLSLDGTYKLTADIFRSINFLKLDSLLEWSVMISLIFNCIFIHLILKFCDMDNIKDVAISIMSVGLLNVYVFNLSKEALQVCVFLICYLIFSAKKLNSITKILLCCLTLLLWGIFYRIYYVLIAAYTLAAYILFKIMFKSERRPVKRYIAAIFFVVLISVLIMAMLMPQEYRTIVNIRNSLTINRIGSADANTLILNSLPYNNYNFILFSANYMIVFLRLLIPLELINGLYYYPFICFQMILTFHLLKILKNADKHFADDYRFIPFCLVIGYLLGSALFEPDFGSYLRHLSASLPVLLPLILNKSNNSGERQGEIYDKSSDINHNTCLQYGEVS